MGARRSTGTGSARWFLFPTNTWEPLLLTRVVQVRVSSDEHSVSIGVRTEKCNSDKGTGGMDVCVVLFTPHIHELL